MAVTVHLEHDGEPICLLLDVVEVARSHSGINLAAAFAEILEDFGIGEKVSYLSELTKTLTHHLLDPLNNLRQCKQ